MSDWSNGYVADIGYTYGYYPELNPMKMKAAFLNAGLVYPETGTACELGFGQGISTNFHAAAALAEWHGTDFNPSQAAFAQELAAVTGAPAFLHDQSFAEFCNRPDLPDFDYIGLHGIWTWISDENRAIIVDFVRRKLKVGGVLYVSYNTMPGWASTVPMRELMLEYNRVMAAPGQPIVSRMDASLDFATRLFEVAPAFLSANPSAKSRFDAMKSANRSYLAHEYFNRDWLPMSFSAMSKWLEPAKLTFACSASLQTHLQFAILNPEQLKFLGAVDDPLFRETVFDFMVNQTFRRDFWVRGQRKLTPQQQTERLLQQRYLLIQDPATISMTQKGPTGEMKLAPEVYQPILHFLGDLKAHTAAEVVAHMRSRDVPPPQVKQALFILLSLDLLHLAQEPEVAARTKPRTDRLNRHLCQLSQDNMDLPFLVSPVTGGGVPVDRITQMMMLARANGVTDPQQVGADLHRILLAQGHRLKKEGKNVQSDAEQLQLLVDTAALFNQRKAAILDALGMQF
jgi:hypothetical protein